MKAQKFELIHDLRQLKVEIVRDILVILNPSKF